jgi:hypothetical protein
VATILSAVASTSVIGSIGSGDDYQNHHRWLSGAA